MSPDELIAGFAITYMATFPLTLAWEFTMGRDTKINWNRTGVNQYTTAQTQKGGYTADIAYTTEYTLTIAGTGAPAPSTHATLRAAKNAFRKFLLSK